MNPTESKQESARQIAVQQAAHDGKRIEKKHFSAHPNKWDQMHKQEAFNWTLYDYRVAAEPPTQETFEEWKNRYCKGRLCLASQPILMSDLESAWDASAANGSDINAKRVEMMAEICDQLTRERDEALTRIATLGIDANARRQLDTIRNTAVYHAERAQQFEKERDEALRELEEVENVTNLRWLDADTLRQQLEVERRHVEFMRRQLSDAQAEVKRLEHDGEMTRENLFNLKAQYLDCEKDLAASQSTIDRLIQERDTWNNLANARAEQAHTIDELRATVERLREELSKVAYSQRDLIIQVRVIREHLEYDQGETIDLRNKLIGIIDAALTSITAPASVPSSPGMADISKLVGSQEPRHIEQPASVPTGLVKKCRDALELCIAGIYRPCDALDAATIALALCNRHLSGEKAEQPVSKPHNPAGLTDWGQADGWRLLDEDEIVPIGGRQWTVEIELWNGSKWDASAWCGERPAQTYRTRLSREQLAAISKGETK